MTAVLAQVHEVVRAADDDDLDLDPALAASVQVRAGEREPQRAADERMALVQWVRRQLV